MHAGRRRPRRERRPASEPIDGDAVDDRRRRARPAASQIPPDLANVSTCPRTSAPIRGWRSAAPNLLARTAGRALRNLGIALARARRRRRRCVLHARQQDRSARPKPSRIHPADAAVAKQSGAPTPLDAGDDIDQDDIVALSRFGFFSIDASGEDDDLHRRQVHRRDADDAPAAAARPAQGQGGRPKGKQQAARHHDIGGRDTTRARSPGDVVDGDAGRARSTLACASATIAAPGGCW